MQKVEIKDDGTLAVYVDGVDFFSKSGEIQSIMGDFTISADDVANLISVFRSKYVRKFSCQNLDDGTYKMGAFILSEEEIVKNYEKKIYILNNNLEEAEKETKRLFAFLQKCKDGIDAFNSMPWYKRIFRKLNVKLD